MREPWTTGELSRLREVAPQGLEAAAALLGRSTDSTRKAAARNGISLRTARARGGRLLYAPSGANADEVIGRIRADAAAGLIELGYLHRLVDLVLAGAPICSCGSRPIENLRIGKCRVCYLKDLRDMHRSELERIALENEVVALRARKYRARRGGKVAS